MLQEACTSGSTKLNLDLDGKAMHAPWPPWVAHAHILVQYTNTGGNYGGNPRGNPRVPPPSSITLPSPLTLTYTLADCQLFEVWSFLALLERMADIDLKIQILKRSMSTFSGWLDQCEQLIGALPTQLEQCDHTHLRELAMQYKVIIIMLPPCTQISINSCQCSSIVVKIIVAVPCRKWTLFLFHFSHFFEFTL